MGKRNRGKKTYTFDKWYLTCPNCKERLAVKSAVNTSYCHCAKCGWEQNPRGWNPRDAVNRFVAKYPGNKIDIQPASLLGKTAKGVIVDEHPDESVSIHDVAKVASALSALPYN